MTNASRKRCPLLSIRRVRRLLVTSFASGADIKTVQARMPHASATTTLDIYGHLWPDADESTRTAIGAVIAERMKTAQVNGVSWVSVWRLFRTPCAAAR